MVFVLKATNFYFSLTRVPARHTLRLSTHQASTTTASTYDHHTGLHENYNNKIILAILL